MRYVQGKDCGSKEAEFPMKTMGFYLYSIDGLSLPNLAFRLNFLRNQEAFKEFFGIDVDGFLLLIHMIHFSHWT